MKTITQRLNAIHNEAVPAIVAALRETGRALLVSATGSGKTNMGIEVAKQFIPHGKKLFVLSHKTDLTDQAIERYKTLWDGIRVGEFSGAKSVERYDVIVATIQSASKFYNLKGIDFSSLGLVIVDECHRAPTVSYRKWLEWAKNVPHLGMTATPIRPDDPGQDLVVNIFGEPVFSLSIAEAIEKRVYANPCDQAKVILTSSVIEGIVSKTGEYSKKALDRTVVSKRRNQTIIEAYIKYGRNALKERGQVPKTICFCINKKHAVRMRKLFRKHKITSEILVSDTHVQSSQDRDEVLEIFRNDSSIEVLCAVNILTEGIDIPKANCILMCRPTRSNIIYTQQLGRGCRFLDEEKEEFVVLDFVDNAQRGFQPYCLSNVTDRPYERRQIIVDWVDCEDPIIVEKRVDLLSTMKGWMLSCKTPAQWKEEILQYFKETGEWPLRDADPVFGARFANYMTPSYDTFDPEFRARCVELGYVSSEDRVKKNKELILELGKAGQWPKKGEPLYSVFHSYMTPSSHVFDPEFRARCVELGYVSTEDRVKKNKELILELGKSGQWPKRGEPLYHAFRDYTGPSSKTFDSEFRAQCIELGFVPRKKGKEKK